jgi:hypothetical protein
MSALLTAVRAVEIVSDTDFRCAGHSFSVPVPAAVDALQAALYTHCYTRSAGPVPAVTGEGDLTASLSAGNPATSRWVDGWTVIDRLPNGTVGIQRGSLVRYVQAAEVRADGEHPGARASTWHPHERTDQPGFYYVFGTAPHDADPRGSLLRLYWNVTPDGAPALVAELARALGRFGVPFIFKCLKHRALYPRADAGVLYVGRRHHRLVCELAAGVHAKLGGGLGSEVPLFTKPLAPGLGLAEDPGGGESFGMHRCRLVAEGVWAARGDGPGQRLSSVERRFADAGLDPARPYLGPLSDDPYHLPGHAH